MSTESQPVAEADIKAALAGHALANGAELPLVRLLSEDLRGVSPSLLKDAVAARLAGDYACFLKPTGPAPGSLGAIASQVQAARSERGGLDNVVGYGPNGAPIVNLAGSMSTGIEHGTGAARAAAQAELDELVRFAGKPPGTPISQLNSAEMLFALGERYRASQASLSGLQIVPQK